jgi:hypothetical protein
MKLKLRPQGGTMEYTFRQLDDLVLHLKGLVLVRKIRQGQGADANELAMYNTEISRVRDRLAQIARPEGARAAAA